MAEDKNLNEELASFRQQWHEEIQNRQINPGEDGSKNVNQGDKNSQNGGKDKVKDAEKEKEKEAAKLFLQGVQMERQKHMYDAIEFYKRAIRLVPDIESRITDYNAGFDLEDNSSDIDNDDFQDERSADLEILTRKFGVLGIGGLCEPQRETKQTHISVLPTELLIYIFRWVVSNELDLRSLEQLSQVCKWFYACARDESVWRSACLRVWNVNCGNPVNFGGCWRQMLIHRPHLHFNGVYINKNSYVRPGEESLDGFYRPYHLVEYYRYLRFYADGTVLVTTTADDPSTVIPTLRRKQQTATTIKGHYRLNDEMVDIITKKFQKNQSESSRCKRSRANLPTTQEQIFHMELLLRNQGRKRNNQLVWVNYSYKVIHRSTGQQMTNQLDVQNYKPFYFSRVKSFHNSSKVPL